MKTITESDVVIKKYLNLFEIFEGIVELNVVM